MKNRLFDRFNSWWKNISAEEKRKVVVILTIVFIVLISLFAYYSTRGRKTEERRDQAVSEIKLETDALRRAQYLESQKMYEELKKEIEELKKLKEEMQKAESVSTPVLPEHKELESVPPPPPSPPPPPPPPSEKPVSQAPPPPQETVIGGISVVKNTEKVEAVSISSKREEGRERGKQEEIKKKYYLPTSFMEATLLSGLDAPAVSKGGGHPVPCLFRIKAPAVLPNEVRANLRGCFVIGEGLGNLASERADIRLVSLSCIDRKGRAVIDEKIKGFVVDSDGKIGLRGRVVSKMGSVLARAFLAGFVSGLGNVLAYQSYYVTMSPEGGLFTVEPGRALQYGLGLGVQQAAGELMRFYMELARQSIPVVEILPTRNVTLVISEGVWLKLKDYETY